MPGGPCWSIARSLVIVLGLLMVISSNASPMQLKQPRRVLIINDLGIVSSPGFAEIDKAIFDALQNSPYQIELYQESLQLTFFPDEAFQSAFHESLIRKYSERKPDLIVAAGPASLKFIAESHESFIRDTPIVFCGLVGDIPEQIKSLLHVTGVLGRVQPEETLRTALHLLPGTEHVVVVGGVGKFDEPWERVTKQAFQKYEHKLDFTYLTDLTMPALLERLRHLSGNTIVYHTSIAQDAAGERFIDSTQSVPLVASAANAPIFVMDDLDLRAGTVGGDLVNWADDGRLAGGMAVRILNGERPEDIPIATSKNVYMFDSRALERWGIKERDLPPGSILLNHQPSAWELYKTYIILGFCVILIQALLIVALLKQRSRARRAETELTIAYDRLRMAVEAGKSVGWDLDVKTGRDRWFGDLQNMFGMTSDTFEGTTADFRRRVHPDDQDVVTKAFTDARQNRTPYVAEFRVLRDDQKVRWITAQGRFYYSTSGDPVRMLGMAVDITERKEAEEQQRLLESALRESEERFRLVANTAPVMIWMSGPDKLCNYFNQQWLEFTGRSLEQELGDGWADGVHPDDLDRCLNIYRQAFDRREPFEMRYRLRRNDGEYRWLLDLGVPRSNPDGFFAGYIGSCMDITDRKIAEEALATIGRRLIQAHEEERAKIGRELHDDVTQRIAMVAIALERFSREHCKSTVAMQQIETACRQLIDLSEDVQALSHNLHSSKLEYLGIAAATRSFCRELAEKHKVEIDFSQVETPRGISDDVALCLFRVLQESLQNAVKYSGARHIRVALRGDSGEIVLSVTDQGAGFDPQIETNRGLGLISMRERVQLVGGDFSIISAPGRGTTVTARVPPMVEENPLREAV